MLSALSSFALTFLVRFAMDAFSAWRAEQTAKAAGRAEAVAEGHEAAARSARVAREAEDQAAARHRAEATDAAFDLDFRRD